MKKILRKNQVIITALAIMIAVAGYLNFTQEKIDQGEQGEVVQTDVQVDGSEVVIASPVPENEESQASPDAQSPEGEDVASAEGELLDISSEDIGEDFASVTDSGELQPASGGNEGGDVGNTVLVNNTIGADFFASAKLSREQTRARNKEILMELVENANTTEQQKENAVNEIVGMTSAAERENAAETMLEARGFGGAVVSIVDEGVDVIVNANELTEQQIAQIEDIVKRKTNVTAENIVITPVGVEE